MRVPRPPWFDVSLSDGLGNKLLTITQAYWFGFKSRQFTNPSNDS